MGYSFIRTVCYHYTIRLLLLLVGNGRVELPLGTYKAPYATVTPIAQWWGMNESNTLYMSPSHGCYHYTNSPFCDFCYVCYFRYVCYACYVNGGRMGNRTPTSNVTGWRVSRYTIRPNGGRTPSYTKTQTV